MDKMHHSSLEAHGWAGTSHPACPPAPSSMTLMQVRDNPEQNKGQAAAGGWLILPEDLGNGKAPASREPRCACF